MARLLIMLSLVVVPCILYAQDNTYTIKADSFKITNCDSSELIIENHTQNIPGFLFNTGNGRTIFKRGAVKINDSIYLVGGDTIKIPKNSPNAWIQGGNSFGATGILGNNDNNHLDLYTNGLQRLRLTNTGNMLLGTATDNQNNTLQVNGSIYAAYLTNSAVKLGGSNGSGAIRLRYGTGDGVYIGIYYQTRNTRRAFIGAPSETRPLMIGDSVGLSLMTPSVCVGGETNSTYAKMFIYNALNSTQDAFASVHVNSSDSLMRYDLEVRKSGNVIIGGGFETGNKLQVTGNVYTSGSVQLAGLTNDNTQTRMLVSDANGKLYYRTTPLASANLIPSSLAVNTLRVRPSRWADYVLSGNYKLPSLAVLGQYIEKNHHLPGIPSAAEVKKNGIEIGENQVVFLKKIEELTLYILEQNKRLERQEEQIQRLQAENRILLSLAEEVKELKAKISK